MTLSLIRLFLFFALGYVSYAKNTCAHWFPMPGNHGLVVVIPLPHVPATESDMDCDGIADALDSDIDGDGIPNRQDVFPRNPLETTDTDGDGIGNHSDIDDDNDGYSDQVEIDAGSDPLDNQSVPSTHLSIGNWVRTNPGAGGTMNMIGATASGELLTASDLSGVYISSDGLGGHWDVLGEVNGLINAHISALGFHPTDGNQFYVGTGSGLLKTNNKGYDFTFVNNLPYNEYNDTYVESITLSRTLPVTTYVTYHSWDIDSPSHIAKTTNGGTTWSDVSFPITLRPANLRIVKLLVHPNNANVLYAIAGKPRWGCSAAKAYKSENGGSIWQEIQHPYDILDIDIDYSDDTIMYMSTFKAATCSENLDLDNYVMYNDDGYATHANVYKSTNRGESFGSPILENQTGIISVGTGNVNTSNKLRVVNILTFANAFWMSDESATGTWESNDYGGTWNHIGSVNDWDIGYSNSPYMAYTFAFNGLSKTLTKDLFNSDKLYGAGGWTLGTFDGGKTFNSLSTQEVSTDKWRSTGLENIEGFALDVNDNNSNIIYMGGYDIGFWVSRDRGESWKWQYPFKNDLLTLNRYTWGAVENEPEEGEPASLKTIGGSNVMTLISDPSHANVVWSSFAKAQSKEDAEVNESDSSLNDRSGLFRSTNYGDTWGLSPIYQKSGTLLNTHYHAVIYGLSVDSSSPVGKRVLYVTIDGHVAKSSDDGRTWHIVHEDGGLKFTAVHNGVVYAGGKSGLWRYKNNIWSQIGGAYKTQMEGIGSPMIVDLTPQDNEMHYDTDYNEIIDAYAWNGVHDIQIAPSNSNIVYVVVYGQSDDTHPKGLYKSVDAGEHWSRVDLGQYENRYLRYIAISPQNPNILFLTSSENINSGANAGGSNGIIYSDNGGATWHDGNHAMAWKFGSKIEIDALHERVWAWSPGTGVQYTPMHY